MPKLRFNIRNLLTIIFVLGVGFAALRESSDIWESATFTLTISVLLISTLLAVHRTSRRTFWIGFALFGSAYLGLSLVPSIESRLITTKGLDYVRFRLSEQSLTIDTLQHTLHWSLASANQVQNPGKDTAGNDTIVTGKGRVWLLDRTSGRLLNAWNGTSENFVRIGHSLFALVVAWLGGKLSRRLYQSQRPSEPTSAVVLEGATP